MNEIYLDSLDENNLKNTFLQYFDWNKFNISFLFVSDFKNAKYLRECFSIILDIVWIEPIWKNRFILIADELNNNSIEYWSKNWEINKFIFSYNSFPDWKYINLEVVDKWNWHSPKKSHEMEKIRTDKICIWFEKHFSIRWRGLFMIITRLVDELYFKDDLVDWWLVVWINKKL